MSVLLSDAHAQVEPFHFATCPDEQLRLEIASESPSEISDGIPVMLPHDGVKVLPVVKILFPFTLEFEAKLILPLVI